MFCLILANDKCTESQHNQLFAQEPGCKPQGSRDESPLKYDVTLCWICHVLYFWGRAKISSKVCYSFLYMMLKGKEQQLVFSYYSVLSL